MMDVARGQKGVKVLIQFSFCRLPVAILFVEPMAHRQGAKRSPIQRIHTAIKRQKPNLALRKKALQNQQPFRLISTEPRQVTSHDAIHSSAIDVPQHGLKRRAVAMTVSHSDRSSFTSGKCQNHRLIVAPPFGPFFPHHFTKYRALHSPESLVQ